MTDRQVTRSKRVQDMIRLILAGEKTRNMTVRQAVKAMSKYFSEGYEGRMEKSMFIQELELRKRRFNIIINLEFADPITSWEHKNKVLKNVMDSLIHTVDTAGIVPDECETYTKRIHVIGEQGEPLFHEFK